MHFSASIKIVLGAVWCNVGWRLWTLFHGFGCNWFHHRKNWITHPSCIPSRYESKYLISQTPRSWNFSLEPANAGATWFPYDQTFLNRLFRQLFCSHNLPHPSPNLWTFQPLDERKCGSDWQLRLNRQKWAQDYLKVTKPMHQEKLVNHTHQWSYEHSALWNSEKLI